MSQAHKITEYEQDFLEDGGVAVCSCGWRSPRGTMPQIKAWHESHVKESESAVGAWDGVPVRLLDALSNAANDESFDLVHLLPYSPDESPLPTPARVEPPSRIYGHDIGRPLPARVEQPASEDICHRSTCGHPLSMHDDNGQCSAPSDSVDHDYGGEIGVQPLPCICPEFVAAPTPPVTGEAANGVNKEGVMLPELSRYSCGMVATHIGNKATKVYLADEIEPILSAYRAERAAHKATREQLEAQAAQHTKWVAKQAVHLFEIGLRSSDKLGVWRNDRAESAEAENQELRRKVEEATEFWDAAMSESVGLSCDYATKVTTNHRAEKAGAELATLREEREKALVLIKDWWAHPSAHSNPVGPMLREAIALLTAKEGQ